MKFSLKEFNQILVSYMKQGITEAVITFDNTGITEIEPILEHYD